MTNTTTTLIALGLRLSRIVLMAPELIYNIIAVQKTPHHRTAIGSQTYAVALRRETAAVHKYLAWVAPAANGSGASENGSKFRGHQIGSKASDGQHRVSSVNDAVTVRAQDC